MKFIENSKAINKKPKKHLSSMKKNWVNNGCKNRRILERAFKG